MLLLKILILVLLLFIGIQDIKSRSVYWLSFPVLTAMLIMLNVLQHHGARATWWPAFLNIGFLMVQLLCVSAYFSLKRKQWVNITAALLGWGDVLFLLSAAFYLSVLNFIFFYVSSLVVVMCVWLIWQRFTKSIKIPLAGVQALLFAIFLAGDWWLIHVDAGSDDWLLKLLIK